MTTRKKLLFGLVTAALAVLATLLAAELALRAVLAVDRARKGDLEQRLHRSKANLPIDGRSADLGGIVQASEFRDVVYELKPDMDCVFYNKPVRTNSRGLRNRETPPEKPEGVFRIVGLGDSVMFGWGVEARECYLEQLERMLNELPPPHPKFEVINFAVPGYNTAIEAAVFRDKALLYDPDLAIIHFVSNDFGVPSFMLKPEKGTEWKQSYLWKFIKARLGRLSRTYEDEGLVYYRFQNVDEKEREKVLEEYAYMAGAEGVERALADLRDHTAPRGIPVILLAGFKSEEQGRYLESLAARNGFEVLDIAPITERALDEAGAGTDPEERQRAVWISRGDHHPNPFGHSIYARGLGEKIAGMLGLDGTAGGTGGSKLVAETEHGQTVLPEIIPGLETGKDGEVEPQPGE